MRNEKKAGERGADALVRALRDARVRTVFTLSGNHVMPIFDALVDSEIDLIHVRHEAAAVHMADAYARLTGEIGVALVTGGPGHANAVSALYTATLAESPVLLLSGHAPHDQLGMGAFQEMAQVEIAAPLTKSAWLSKSSSEVAGDVKKAVALALSGRPGAVHLSLPTDCLEGRASNDRSDGPHVTANSLAEAQAAAVADRLARAKRPIVLTGPQSLTKRGREQMRRLEEQLGIAVVGMESPRDILDPSLGAFAEVLAKADCVLLLGKRLDYTLKFGRAPVIDAECVFLQVDPDQAEIDRAQRAVASRLAISAVADVFDAAEAIGRHATKVTSTWRDEVHAAIAYRPSAWDAMTSSASGRLHPVQALRPLQSLLDAHPDSVLVGDGGEFGQWALACVSAPNRIINGVAGPIGVALPFAIAARIAKPDVPVITILGDGTFGFHAAEIDTAVRYSAPFVAVLGNDARWNAEYQIQVREYGEARAKGCDLLPARYDHVTVAFGGHGEYVTQQQDLLPAVKRAQSSNLPACVNVMIDGSAAPVIKRRG
jgi:acetolactate synthase-1/2/3 large subunit